MIFYEKSMVIKQKRMGIDELRLFLDYLWQAFIEIMMPFVLFRIAWR